METYNTHICSELDNVHAGACTAGLGGPQCVLKGTSSAKRTCARTSCTARPWIELAHLHTLRLERRNGARCPKHGAAAGHVLLHQFDAAVDFQIVAARVEGQTCKATETSASAITACNVRCC